MWGFSVINSLAIRSVVLRSAGDEPDASAGAREDAMDPSSSVCILITQSGYSCHLLFHSDMVTWLACPASMAPNLPFPNINTTSWPRGVSDIEK